MGLILAIVIVVLVIALIALALSSSNKNGSKSEEGESKAPNKMTAEEKEKYKKEKQEREWTDPNEYAKYVCHGGKAQCKYCNQPISDIIVTSDNAKLQDKAWATIHDKNGLVNFNFKGQCMHPSQQKPLSPPPPCKGIIQLGEWKDFSETKIGGDTDHALLVQSTIPCMISNEDIIIVDSGQKAELSRIEPRQKRVPRIVDVFLVDKSLTYKLDHYIEDDYVYIYVKTEDILENEQVVISWKNEELVGIVNNKGEALIKWSSNPYIKKN